MLIARLLPGRAGLEVLLLPGVLGFQSRPGVHAVLLHGVAPAVVAVDIHHVGGVGLGQRAVAADDEQVLIVLIRRFVPQVVAAGDHHAVLGERIHDHDLVVDDGVGLG